MTFTEKSLISLLSLPDFLEYILRKSKKSQNKVQFGDNKIETSRLVISSYKCLAQINSAVLFRFIEIDSKILNEALQINIEYWYRMRKTADNSSYKKLAVQWLNEALGFVSSFVVVDSLVLRNRQLLIAASH